MELSNNIGSTTRGIWHIIKGKNGHFQYLKYLDRKKSKVNILQQELRKRLNYMIMVYMKYDRIYGLSIVLHILLKELLLIIIYIINNKKDCT